MPDTFKFVTIKKTDMKNILLILLIITVGVACQSSEKQAENTQPEPKKVLPVDGVPTLEVESYKESLDQPHSIVSVVMGNRKVKVAEAMSCEMIDKKDFADYQIPGTALAACGGWWAGSGDYFYIVQTGEGNYDVMHGVADEASEASDYGYKVIMNINLETGITPI